VVCGIVDTVFKAVFITAVEPNIPLNKLDDVILFAFVVEGVRAWVVVVIGDVVEDIVGLVLPESIF